MQPASQLLHRPSLKRRQHVHEVQWWLCLDRCHYAAGWPSTPRGLVQAGSVEAVICRHVSEVAPYAGNQRWWRHCRGHPVAHALQLCCDVSMTNPWVCASMQQERPPPPRATVHLDDIHSSVLPGMPGAQCSFLS